MLYLSSGMLSVGIENAPVSLTWLYFPSDLELIFTQPAKHIFHVHDAVVVKTSLLFQHCVGIRRHLVDK